MREVALELKEMFPDLSYSKAYDMVEDLLNKRWIQNYCGEYVWNIPSHEALKEYVDARR